MVLARRWRLHAVALLAALCGCPSSGDTCSASAEKEKVWLDAREGYLYTDLLPASVNLDLYATPSDLLDAITETARAQGKDRYWSFVTTRESSDQYFSSGQTVGFGLGLLVRGTSPALRLLVSQVIAGSAAADAGFVRGDEILAIGPDGAHLEPVGPHLADGTLATLFPPPIAGEVRAFQVQSLSGDAPVRTVTTRVYDLVPVPSTWVANGVGYVGLRTFVSTAGAPLRAAFRTFQDAGVSGVVVDLRYNGGGLVSIAELLADLLGGGLAPQKMYDLLLNSGPGGRASFAAQAEAISDPTLKVAFITTGASASASELVANVLDPYRTIALVGSPTYGKPVGQFGYALTPCSDVLFLVAFGLVNALGHGDYYAGLPDGSPDFHAAFCPAADDLTQPQNGLAEASTAAALHWLATGTCPPAPAGAGGLRSAAPATSYPPASAPTPAQRHIPGLF